MTTNKKVLGLYIHIPFCIKKCRYCAFLSYDGAEERSLHSAYTRALIEEIRFWGRKTGAEETSVDSIFIGGGTPSILPEEEILAILQACRNYFDVSEDAEITLESNPGTLSKEKLLAYQAMGINRLSIGVQALNDQLLAGLGRIHTAEDFIRNYKEARAAGFTNINIDLMFGIPGQTPALWEETLKQAIGLQPEHLSFYSLQIEEDTPFYDLFAEGSLKETDDQTDRKMYHTAIAELEKNGYLHYETSNASKPGFSCRHNLKYWSMDEYLGLGLGAHSYFNAFRFSNETELSSYIAKADQSKGKEESSVFTDPKESPFVVWSHQNTEKDEISEYIFTGLRRIDGISRAAFLERFSVFLDDLFEKEIKGHLKKGLLENAEDGDRLRLTAEGVDLSNYVMVDFV